MDAYGASAANCTAAQQVTSAAAAGCAATSIFWLKGGRSAANAEDVITAVGTPPCVMDTTSALRSGCGGTQ